MQFMMNGLLLTEHFSINTIYFLTYPYEIPGGPILRDDLFLGVYLFLEARRALIIAVDINAS
jgi:hypothetical protein